MAKIKRVPRKKPNDHKDIDVMKPFNYKDLGTSNDPCFGKHYDITAPECKRCGDAEVCAMASANKMLLDAGKIAKTNRFKDVEEGQLIDEQNEEIRKYVVAKAKKRAGKVLLISKLVPIFREKFNLTEKDDAVITNRIIKAIEKDKHITLNSKKTRYEYSGS